MFDIAWSELALIAAVALIVIGPKDLPRVMRSLGQWVRRGRMMAAEFQRNLDEMMREAELHELRKEVESISPAAFKAEVESMIDLDSIKDSMAIRPERLVTPAAVADAGATTGAEVAAEPPVTAPPAPTAPPDSSPAATVTPAPEVSP